MARIRGLRQNFVISERMAESLGKKKSDLIALVKNVIISVMKEIGQVEDQLFIGENVMVAPVCEQNVTGRVVYFQERMKKLIFKDGIVEEGKVYEKGFSYVEMPMGTVHIFLREGYLFPVAKGGKCVEAVDFEDLTLYSFGEEIKPYEYYLDDGETKDFALESHIRMLSC